MIRVEQRESGHVRLVGEFNLPFDAASAWRSLRDFERFVCMDLFHRAVRLNTPRPMAGTEIAIDHRLLGLGFERVGRILHWREGRSYAFSDLSRRDARLGFPHVYVYTLEPLDASSCRFRLEVRGRWTARFLGRSMTRVWLTWILFKTTVSLRNAFLFDALVRARQAGDSCRRRRRVNRSG